MECRLRATQDQFMVLLKFMESNGDLGRPPPGLQGRVKNERLWQQLGKLVNSSPGGVVRPLEKWKRVWADWKTKTKKKAMTIRRAATGGGPASKLRLTAPEKRVLALMGIKSVFGPDKTEKEDIQEPIKRDPLSPTTTDTAHSEYTSYTVTDDADLNFIPVYSIESSTPVTPPPSEITRRPSPQVSKPPPVSTIPPPNAATTRRVIRRWRPVTRTRVISSTTSAMRRQRQNSARERHQTPFQQNSNDFANIEVARLQLEVEREKNNHQREMERLRLENRRIEMEENRNETISRLVGVLESLTEILPQLRPS